MDLEVIAALHRSSGRGSGESAGGFPLVSLTMGRQVTSGAARFEPFICKILLTKCTP
jgi:hypothetical protein